MKKNLFFMLFVIVLGFILSAMLLQQKSLFDPSMDWQKRPTPVRPNLPSQDIPNIVPQNPIVKLDDAIKFIDAAELQEHLEYLSSPELEGRMSGKKGNVSAANFVAKQFESYGLKVEFQKLGIRRMNNGPNNEVGDNFTQNVYGVLEGTNKNEIVVVGAHLDHIGYGPNMSRTPRNISVHPGADDNASGTVALLQIAKVFSKLSDKTKRTIIFQAYSAEEMGLLGSRFYCDNPLYPKDQPSIDKHIFMLNMDMVGRLGAGEYFAGFNEAESSVDIAMIIDKLENKYKFAKNITSRKTGGSDHASFYNKKVPIAFLHTGGHLDYHTPNDTPDKINYDGIAQIAKYAAELTYEVANSEVIPAFNLDTFKTMDYKHDHGTDIKFPSDE
jgi:metal-dependent amidase/aminoacylase/carboxypeptidase family protein